MLLLAAEVASISTTSFKLYADNTPNENPGKKILSFMRLLAIRYYRQKFMEIQQFPAWQDVGRKKVSMLVVKIL